MLEVGWVPPPKDLPFNFSRPKEERGGWETGTTISQSLHSWISNTCCKNSLFKLKWGGRSNIYLVERYSLYNQISAGRKTTHNILKILKIGRMTRNRPNDKEQAKWHIIKPNYVENRLNTTKIQKKSQSFESSSIKRMLFPCSQQCP